MAQSERSVYVDSEIVSQITSLIQEAQKEIMIVTPYLQLMDWGHVKRNIELAIKRGAKIKFLIRDDEKVLNQEDVDWLLDQKVVVYSVERLHAKIYMNEKSILVSSMNLNQSSANNSLEIALLVRNRDDAVLVRHYVQETLMKVAVPVDLGDTEPVEDDEGFCLRCRAIVLLDPVRPLCEDCYREWSRWGNEDYEEKYCHLCGEPRPTSYARPLCRSCYGRAVR